jgi:hypothetical protein
LAGSEGRGQAVNGRWRLQNLFFENASVDSTGVTGAACVSVDSTGLFLQVWILKGLAESDARCFVAALLWMTAKNNGNSKCNSNG